MKTEMVYQKEFKTKVEAKLSVFEYIEAWYNSKEAFGFGIFDAMPIRGYFNNKEIVCLKNSSNKILQLHYILHPLFRSDLKSPLLAILSYNYYIILAHSAVTAIVNLEKRFLSAKYQLLGPSYFKQALKYSLNIILLFL